MGFFEVFATALAGFYALIPSYGLAIILLTLAVRIVLLPLSIKQTRSQREMQRIMPEVKAIQKKYKGDRQKVNEATMALYKEHGVNPFGGCAPLLMQFPVLIALYYVVRTPLAYMGYIQPKEAAPFGEWQTRNEIPGILERIQQSSLADALRERTLEVHQFLGLRLDCATNSALAGDDPSVVGQPCGSGLVDALPYLVLVALMGLSTWYMQKQLSSNRGAVSDQQAAQMQMFTRIMPFMLMFFAYSFPTGVVVYWLTTNIWTIGQQQLVLRVVPLEPPGGAPPKDEAGTRSGTAATGRTGPGKPPKQSPAKGAGDDGQRSPTRASKPHPSSKKKKKR
ncbi:MAG: YidC/Oxa1 family membrane protein insertase [Actinomycetota bacterium]|nr:YidC/Oxa1 family membrane protein insertase [Actinomycetota bacterium]